LFGFDLSAEEVVFVVVFGVVGFIEVLGLAGV
jgi:hypothetical protein